jgi:hypothetical protein
MSAFLIMTAVHGLVERSPDPSEETSAEPEKRRGSIQRELTPVPVNPRQQSPKHIQRIAVRQRGRLGRKKPVEQLGGIDFRLVDEALGEEGESDQE